jgi:Domain of unknown function (DUF4136)
MAGCKSALFLSRLLRALTLVLIVSVAAQGQKIHVNKYDPTADFSKFKTYAWTPHGAVAHPILAADIVGSIEDQLTQKGLKLVASNPDLIIQVYGSIDQESTFYSNDPLYGATGGIPPFDPSFSGPALAGTWGNTTVTIHKGELVVDLIDANAKKLVWRGMAQQNLSTKPEKLLSQVQDAVVKMFKQCPVGRP